MNNNFNGLLLMGDLMLSGTNPPDRIGGDYFNEIRTKLEYALALAKEKNLLPVLAGTLTLQSFEISVYEYLIRTLLDSSSTVVTDEKESEPGTVSHLLTSSRVVDSLSTINPSKAICIQGVPYNLTFKMSLGYKVVSLQDVNGKTMLSTIVQPFGSQHETPLDEHSFALNPIARVRFADQSYRPSFYAWTPEGALEAHELPMMQDVFNADTRSAPSNTSAFASMLKEETERAAEGKSHELITAEMMKIFTEFGCSAQTMSTVEELYGNAKTPTFDDLMEE